MSDDTQSPTPTPEAEPTARNRVFHLFLVPLGIVVLLVTVVVAFGYLGYVGQNARDHVEQLRHPTRLAWQSAASLSQMLRDPRHAELRQDQQLARDLAAILEKHLATPADDERHVNLRVFLCRALGEFNVPDGLPVLLKASLPDGNRNHLPVRLAALEAIAVLIDRQGSTLATDEPQLLPTLLDAARQSSVDTVDSHDAELIRERAAFALGVLGGSAGIGQLGLMLDDPYANVRFNAATGLARYGDVRSVPILVQMLDPDNPAVVAGESTESDAQEVKRTNVLINALRASRQLSAKNPEADIEPLVAAIGELGKADVGAAVRLEAKAVLNDLLTRSPKSGYSG